MPKGRQRKIKGAICNIPVDCDQTCNILPRPPERSGIILLKLKRKLEFRGHVYFQPVRPQVVLDALKWLKTNNPLYSNIGVDIDNIDTNLTTLQQNENVSEQNPVLNTIGGMGNTTYNEPNPNGQNTSPDNEAVDNDVTMTNMGNTTLSREDNSDDDNTPDDEEKDDPLNEHRAPTNEICFQSLIPDYPVTVEQNNEVSSGNEIYNIALGENKHPVSFMMDKIVKS